MDAKVRVPAAERQVMQEAAAGLPGFLLGWEANSGAGGSDGALRSRQALGGCSIVGLLGRLLGWVLSSSSLSLADVRMSPVFFYGSVSGFEGRAPIKLSMMHGNGRLGPGRQWTPGMLGVW